MMAFWGCYGIAFGAICEQIGFTYRSRNILGSLFYGTMLGIISCLHFIFRSVNGTSAFSED